MSAESVRQFLAEAAPDIEIVTLPMSSTTASMSAAWQIEPAQVAKTLALRVRDRVVLVVTCGDSRLDSRRVRAELGGKASMLSPDEAAEVTGHPVGGICPFGLAAPLPIYFDIRLGRYDIVVPAAGSTHAALRIAPDRFAQLVDATWVDIC